MEIGLLYTNVYVENEDNIEKAIVNVSQQIMEYNSYALESEKIHIASIIYTSGNSLSLELKTETEDSLIKFLTKNKKLFRGICAKNENDIKEYVDEFYYSSKNNSI